MPFLAACNFRSAMFFSSKIRIDYRIIMFEMLFSCNTQTAWSALRTVESKRRNSMKHKNTFLLAVLTLTLITAAFSVGRASATTGCFGDTNGHWAEGFICWMKDEGITSGVGAETTTLKTSITPSPRSS
jgi:hypothetical protein